jgi:hypothetical protein
MIYIINTKMFFFKDYLKKWIICFDHRLNNARGKKNSLLDSCWYNGWR